MYATGNHALRARAECVAIAGVWIAAVVAANLTADWFVPVAGVQFAVGTLVFGATFTLRDWLHRHGRGAVYVTIAIGAAINLLLSIWLGVPLRIIGASFLAIVLAESLDTEVFHALRQRAWWVRALSSNALSIPADTLLFTALAFGGVLPWLDFWQVVAGDTVVKFAIGGVLIWAYQRS